MDLQRLLETARSSAAEAAEVHRAHRGSVHPGEWSEKQAADFVTHVDREAEEVIVRRIREAFPDHSILAEEGTVGTALAEGTSGESGAQTSSGTGSDAASKPAGGAGAGAGERAREILRDPAGPEWLWVIDPLDGTTNFLHGYPVYAASVAVLHRGEPVAGAVATSATEESWWAVRGGGAFHQGSRVHVSEIERMPQALIGTGFPFKALDRMPEYLGQFDRVMRATSGVRRAGAAALDLCHLATGWFDGFWELVLSPWDYAAGALLVTEAGGIVTSLGGGDVFLGDGSVLAGNPFVHGRLGEVLRER